MDSFDALINGLGNYEPDPDEFVDSEPVKQTKVKAPAKARYEFKPENVRNMDSFDALINGLGNYVPDPDELDDFEPVKQTKAPAKARYEFKPENHDEPYDPKKSPATRKEQSRGAEFVPKAENTVPPNPTLILASTFVRVMDCILKHLPEYGYKLVPDGGNFAGFSCFVSETSSLACNRWKIPYLKSEVSYWVPIEPSVSNNSKLYNSIIRIEYQNHFPLDQVTSTEFHSLVKGVAYDICYKGKDANTDVSKYAVSIYNPENLAFRNSTSLFGKHNTVKTLPKAEWFPDSVRSLTEDDLLTILPEAERKSLMLTLGRVCVGTRGESPIELGSDRLNHTYRSLALIVGTSAGLGKSWIFNDMLIPALQKCGYVVTSLSQSFNEFAFNAASTADLIFIDDLTKSSQTALLHSPNIKTLVSNGTMAVNEKFKPIRDVKTRAVVVACTNHFSYGDFIEMDSGSISRLNTLSTKHRIEVVTKDLDERVMTVWHQIADKLKVDINLLALWLIRKATDDFLSVIGYTFDGKLLVKTHKDTLEDTMIGLRQGYRIKLGVDHVDELVNMTFNFWRHGVKEGDLTEDMTFEPVLINRAFLGEVPFEFQAILPKQTIEHQRKISKMLTTLNPKDGLQLVLDHISTAEGYAFPRSLSAYMSKWNELCLIKSQYDASI